VVFVVKCRVVGRNADDFHGEDADRADVIDDVDNEPEDAVLPVFVGDAGVEVTTVLDLSGRTDDDNWKLEELDGLRNSETGDPVSVPGPVEVDGRRQAVVNCLTSTVNGPSHPTLATPSGTSSVESACCGSPTPVTRSRLSLMTPERFPFLAAALTIAKNPHLVAG